MRPPCTTTRAPMIPSDSTENRVSEALYVNGSPS
jgi:hypothetical protein